MDGERNTPIPIQEGRRFAPDDLFDQSGGHTLEGRIVNGIRNRLCVLANTGIGEISKPLNPFIRQQTEQEMFAACEIFLYSPTLSSAIDIVNQYDTNYAIHESQRLKRLAGNQDSAIEVDIVCGVDIPLRPKQVVSGRTEGITLLQNE